jgi:hypothetical protein
MWRPHRAKLRYDAAGLAAYPWLWLLLLCCGCVDVRLATCPNASPVAMAVEVSVGYVRWVGVWARAWEGPGALREGPSGMG